METQDVSILMIDLIMNHSAITKDFEVSFSFYEKLLLLFCDVRETKGMLEVFLLFYDSTF
jgi:hypothetical protein